MTILARVCKAWSFVFSKYLSNTLTKTRNIFRSLCRGCGRGGGGGGGEGVAAAEGEDKEACRSGSGALIRGAEAEETR